MAGTKTKKPNVAADSRPLDSQTPPPGYRYRTARVNLPRWYIDRLDEEAAFHGLGSRSGFLNALLRRKTRRMLLQRLPNAPKVVLPQRKELGPVESYVWNLPAELKPGLDAMLEQLGGITVKSWIVLCLHDWLGLPHNPDLQE